MFDTALSSVPATNPACTAIVSHAAWPGEMSNSAIRSGVDRGGREPQRHAEELRQRDDAEHLPRHARVHGAPVRVI